MFGGGLTEAGTRRLKNYFNYFTEVEEYFVKKRSKNLLISPLDWCLIELWKDEGIPLHIALRGIDRSFEAAEKRRGKSPTTLFYCHPAVSEAFEEYQRAMVGATSPSPVSTPAAPFAPRQVLDHLQELRKTLERQTGDAFTRGARRLESLEKEVAAHPERDYRELDQDLNQLARRLADDLREQLPAKQVDQLKIEVRKELKLYRKHLSKASYARLQNSYLERKIRQLYDLPDFSLLELSV